jgi:hypothetical protein
MLSFVFPGWQDHVVSMMDRTTSSEISSEFDRDGTMTADYGLVVRARNPLADADSGAEVLIVAGCSGYGTAAAAEILGRRALHRDVATRRQSPFEALVRTTVVGRAPHSASLVEIRALAEFRG